MMTKSQILSHFDKRKSSSKETSNKIFKRKITQVNTISMRHFTNLNYFHRGNLKLCLN